MFISHGVRQVGRLAVPLLMLAGCSSIETQPVAPAVLNGAGDTECIALERNFEVLSPAQGPICGGMCTRILWHVANPCGDFVVTVEGWYDGVYEAMDPVKNGYSIHWDSPGGPHARLPVKNSVLLRLKAVDALGVIGLQEVTLGPVVPMPPGPRVPAERD